MEHQSQQSSSSAPPNEPKKFKLDPLSLLLPHERQKQSSSALATARPPKQATPGGGGPQAAFMAMLREQQQQQSTDKAVRPGAVRQTSSMGERSGQRTSEGSGQQYASLAPQLDMPISPPASLMSTPPSTWEASSISSAWGSMEGVVEEVSSSSSHPHRSPRRTESGRYGSGTGYAHQPAGGKARLEDWEIVETLGTGTFGRVLLVRQRPSYRHRPYHPIFPHVYQSLDPLSSSPASTQQADEQLPHFAMKVLRKSEIVRLKQVEHINSERHILERVRHPCIVELYATYQDHLNVYMLLSYIPGGELFSHLRRAGRFSADVARFYLASIVLAIEYLHSYNTIYRDLKPENLLLDRVGYLRIADFGFAKEVEDRTFTLCGTPEYLAPEIVLSQGHGKAVDWWALGILAFELLAGYPPFFDDHPLGIYEKILRNEIAFPSHIDPYAKDLIRGLLTTDRSKRLGNFRNGAKDVMSHAWFAGVDWGSLERKEIGAPIVPRVVSMGDSQNFQSYPPPRPHELPGIFGAAYDVSTDQYGAFFSDFTFPGGGAAQEEQPEG